MSDQGRPASGICFSLIIVVRYALMFRFSFIFLVLVIIGLILTNVIEVKINYAKVKDLPGTVMAFIQNGAMIERVRTQGIWWKRLVEQRFGKDDSRRLELAWLYVKTDADNLVSLISEPSPAAPKILPQTKLLEKSLSLARELENKVSIEVSQQFRAESVEALTSVQNAHNALVRLQGEYAILQKTTDDIARKAGFTPGAATSPFSISPSPTSVPLRF